MSLTHRNPNSADAASAAYNFVPLHDKVTDGGLLADHSRYHSDRMSGVVKCKLTTKSPVYIAGEDEGEEKRFFHHGDPNQPVIPGSSLRGMLRSLVEIISYSKLKPITTNKLFFRDIRNRNYQLRFMSQGHKSDGTPVYWTNVKAGFLREKGGNFSIEPCELTRIDRNNNRLLPNNLYQRVPGGRQTVPRWNYQNKDVWVEVEEMDDHFFKEQRNRHGRVRHPDLYLRFRKVTRLSWQQRSDLQKGTLVITGDMQHKHLEFVFLHKKDAMLIEGDEIDLIVERFNSDDQISRWQERAFPNDEPQWADTNRGGDGKLRDGEPIFYLEDNSGKVEFFGRAQLFRLPFGSPPSELLPDEHKKKQQIDFAEALFGFVDKPKPNGKKHTAAGRVFVGDAVMPAYPADVWLDNESPTFKAKNLASPKPTAYRNYLVQPDQYRERGGSRTYQSADGLIRGHKLYWHQGKYDSKRNPVPLERRDIAHPNQDSQTTQDVWIRPIRTNLTFTFDIHFENLSKAELGALLWAISPPFESDSYEICHKIGMGKPLGMGSVHIEIESVSRVNHEKRYTTLFKNKEWVSGHETVSVVESIESFEKAIASQLRLSDSFRKQSRIMALVDMMKFPGVLRDAVAYPSLDDRGEWVKRLPTPSMVYQAHRLIKPQQTQQSALVQPQRKDDIKAGMYLEGKVVKVTEDHVLLDIGVGVGKLTSNNLSKQLQRELDRFYLDELPELQVGKTMKLWVRRINKKGNIQLTMKSPN